MNFGKALETLKQGGIVRRSSWPAGSLLFLQVPATIPQDVIPRMQSLPQAVKDELAARGDGITYSNQFAFLTPENCIFGWAPSPVEALAEDWENYTAARPAEAGSNIVPFPKPAEARAA